MNREENNCMYNRESEIDEKIEQYFIDEEKDIVQYEKIPGKHFKHMTKEEITYLLMMKTMSLRKGVIFSKHSIDRMRDRRIRKRDVIKALKTGQIIDYRYIDNSEIVTIRSCYLNRGDEQVYVVFALNKGKVITTYSNRHFAAKYKMSHLERYEENYKIKIPEYYKKIIKFYHV